MRRSGPKVLRLEFLLRNQPRWYFCFQKDPETFWREIPTNKDATPEAGLVDDNEFWIVLEYEIQMMKSCSRRGKIRRSNRLRTWGEILLLKFRSKGSKDFRRLPQKRSSLICLFCYQVEPPRPMAHNQNSWIADLAVLWLMTQIATFTALKSEQN